LSFTVAFFPLYDSLKTIPVKTGVWFATGVAVVTTVVAFAVGTVVAAVVVWVWFPAGLVQPAVTRISARATQRTTDAAVSRNLFFPFINDIIIKFFCIVFKQSEMYLARELNKLPGRDLYISISDFAHLTPVI